jgi:hypothetical protein
LDDPRATTGSVRVAYDVISSDEKWEYIYTSETQISTIVDVGDSYTRTQIGNCNNDLYPEEKRGRNHRGFKLVHWYGDVFLVGGYYKARKQPAKEESFYCSKVVLK